MEAVFGSKEEEMFLKYKEPEVLHVYQWIGEPMICMMVWSKLGQCYVNACNAVQRANLLCS